MTLRDMLRQLITVMAQLPKYRWDEEIVVEILPSTGSETAYSCSAQINKVTLDRSETSLDVIVLQLVEGEQQDD